MKKKMIYILLIILFGSFMITACGNKETDSESNSHKKTNKIEKMSKEEINDKLNEVNNDLTDFWNNVISDISWYTSYGTSATGETLDIEFLVKTSKKYYDKVVKNKEFVDSLGEEYEDLVVSYDKAVEQATIIYDAIHEDVPVPNQRPAYKENIELFKQYSDYFWNGVYDLED